MVAVVANEPAAVVMAAVEVARRLAPLDMSGAVITAAMVASTMVPVGQSDTAREAKNESRDRDEFAHHADR